MVAHGLIVQLQRGRQRVRVVRPLAQQVDEVHGKFVPPQLPLGWAGPPPVYTPPTLPQRANRLLGALDSYTAAPTTQQLEEVQIVTGLLGETMERLKKLVDVDLAELNRMMNAAGIPHIRLSGSDRTPGRRP